MAPARTGLKRALAALLTAALALICLGASRALAVTPLDKYAAMPASTGLKWSSVDFKSTRDEAQLTGWWFEGKPDQPVLVLFDRDTGSMGDLMGVTKGFVERGFTVMTFDYRDFGPAGPGPVDSLAQLAFASRWVNDGEGALRFVRTKAGSRPVFAWGQGLGGAVALAAVARDRNNADGLSCESLFRTLPELLRASGLSQVPAAVERHRFLVETSDEPLTAASGLHVPMHLTLGKKDDVWPNSWAQDVARQCLSRVDRWIVPEGGHRGLELTPGYHDRLAAWFQRMGTMVQAARAAEVQAKASTPADSAH